MQLRNAPRQSRGVPRSDAIDFLREDGRACRKRHHHIVAKDLLDDLGLVSQLCRHCRELALQELTTLTAAVAAQHPPDDASERVVAAKPVVEIPERPGSTPANGAAQAPGRMLGSADRRTGLSRVTIWRMQRSGDFPKAITLGRRAVGWREGEVEDWLAKRAVKQTDGQPPYPVTPALPRTRNQPSAQTG